MSPTDHDDAPRPVRGIAVDAAHSEKRRVTEYQGVDIATGKRLFYHNLGYATVNIGEFTAIMHAVRYLLDHPEMPGEIYSDSVTALSWYMSGRTASTKANRRMYKAEMFRRATRNVTGGIEVKYWNNRLWGETPADFGNK